MGAVFVIVEASDDLTLISVASFRATDFIDGGDTAVVKLTGADGGEIAVIMSLRVAMDMARSLDEASRSLGPDGERPRKGVRRDGRTESGSASCGAPAVSPNVAPNVVGASARTAASS